jgi:outer membrane protein assembly factor BamB
MLRFAWSLSLVVLVAIVITVHVPLIAIGDDWPHWRGPNRNGVVAEPSGFRDGNWLAAEPAWKVQVGEGSTSPLVVDGYVYVMGWQADREHLICLNATSGKEIWKQSYAAPRYGRHAEGDQRIYSGTSATPEFDSQTGLLYTLGIDGDLHAWDTRDSGGKRWHVNLYDRYRAGKRPRVGRSGHRDYGYTTSPLVHGDWLLLEVGGPAGSVVAVDKRTGEHLWGSEQTDPAGHTGGLVPMQVQGVPCLVVLTHFHLLVVRLDHDQAGKTVVAFAWETDFANNIATPAVAGDHVIFTSAYNHHKIVKLKITLSGASKIWEQDYTSKVCSPVIHQGHVYWAWRSLHCLDLETGILTWQLPGFGDPGSCIVTADDRLITWADNGKLILSETAVRSPEQAKVLVEKDPIASTDAWPHVVIAGGQLLLKDRAGTLIAWPLQNAVLQENR